MRCMPLSQCRGESICDKPYDAPHFPHKVEVARHMAEVEGVGSGSGATREPCYEAVKSSNRCFHHEAPGLPQQGTL